MSQIVVDSDVASHLFNWHSLAQSYANALQGSELILSFMSAAELRMGAISAGWGGPHWRWTPHSQRITGGIMSTSGAFSCSSSC